MPKNPDYKVDILLLSDTDESGTYSQTSNKNSYDTKNNVVALILQKTEPDQSEPASANPEQLEPDQASAAQPYLEEEEEEEEEEKKLMLTHKNCPTQILPTYPSVLTKNLYV
ncbi:MAG: hypothetical protein NT124_02130 [Candidatus Dependentiae bacterium]|nr:hypothetical protein [Candidatus Dependentiae bacterium]